MAAVPCARGLDPEFCQETCQNRDVQYMSFSDENDSFDGFAESVDPTGLKTHFWGRPGPEGPDLSKYYREHLPERSP